MSACRRVLVIENHVDAGEALCALLETRGHQTALAVSGQRGIQRAVRDRPDVIILDLGLSDLDGCKVAELIRSTRMGHEPLILAYTGYHHRKAEALNAGCDVFVLKPDVEQLESSLMLTRDSACQSVARSLPTSASRR
jgi:CheY-like chemotaxis protein